MKKPANKTAIPYSGFAVDPETMTDGWVYGAITSYDHNSKGCRSGDGFVVAPDGSRAGLDWVVGSKPGRIRQVAPPDAGSWGVFEAVFAKPVFTVTDLVQEFRAILPEIKRSHGRIHGPDTNHTAWPSAASRALCYTAFAGQAAHAQHLISP